MRRVRVPVPKFGDPACLEKRAAKHRSHRAEVLPPPGGLHAEKDRAFARRAQRDLSALQNGIEGGYPMNIRPLHDRIVVKRGSMERKTAAGIVIPDTASEKPDQGEVVAIGDGKRLENGALRAPAVNVGDKVLFGKYAGTTVKIRDEELLVLREDDIVGVLEAA
jgi:chaperonin GroES